MRRISWFLGLGLTFLLFPAAGPAQTRTAPAEPPRAIIFFIGDGLGYSQLAFTRNLLYGKDKRLALEAMPVRTMMSTWSASNAVTDSGAAATAMAAGVKTDNKYVGLVSDPADPDRLKPVHGIADQALARGWKVGYVTTTRITHATPASFYAHRPRWEEEPIAEELLAQKPHVALGGGLGFFLPAPDGERRDGRNLIAEAEKAGYTVWTRGADLTRTPPGRLLGLFANDHLSYVLDDLRYPEERRDPSLAALTRLALESLGQEGGRFFLMVEGGRIDHAGHAFDAAGVAAETKAFDEAVAAALRYQKEHPDTLIVLTADHATGGLAINDFTDWEGLKRQKASTPWMTAQIRNAGATAVMLGEMTGYGDFTTQEVEEIRQAPSQYDAERILGTLLGKRNGITWLPRVNANDTSGHTGEDVPFYASGPGAESFRRMLDNTDVPKIFAELLGWDWPYVPPAARTDPP